MQCFRLWRCPLASYTTKHHCTREELSFTKMLIFGCYGYKDLQPLKNCWVSKFCTLSQCYFHLFECTEDFGNYLQNISFIQKVKNYYIPPYFSQIFNKIVRNPFLIQTFLYRYVWMISHHTCFSKWQCED